MNDDIIINQLPGLRSFITKVFLLATMLIGVVLFYYFFTSQLDLFEREQRSHYQQLQQLLLISAEDAIIAEDLNVLANVIKSLGEGDSSIASLMITNDEGVVIAEWKTPRVNSLDQLKLPNAVVDINGRSQGTISLVIDLSYHRALIRAFVQKGLMIIAMMLLLLLGLQLYLVNKIAIKPLQKIEFRLMAMADGDLDITFNAGGSEEFAQLSRSLNTVAVTLQKQRTAERIARKELESLNSAYIRFVPETFLQMLGKDNIVNVKLGDHSRSKLTIMFTDIRSFTPLAEKMSAEQTFNFINDYFAHLGPIVRQYNGVIDKYIGDAIMALFISPNDAIDAGIAMLETLKEFNTKRIGEEPIRMGIGLHTGFVMLGTIGEKFRMEGTVIGDVVNLAARLESLTKTYNLPLLISEVTKIEAELEEDERFNITFIDEVFAKGKSKPTRVHSVEALPMHRDLIKESISGIRESLSKTLTNP